MFYIKENKKRKSLNLIIKNLEARMVFDGSVSDNIDSYYDQDSYQNDYTTRKDFSEKSVKKDIPDKKSSFNYIDRSGGFKKSYKNTNERYRSFTKPTSREMHKAEPDLPCYAADDFSDVYTDTVHHVDSKHGLLSNDRNGYSGKQKDLRVSMFEVAGQKYSAHQTAVIRNVGSLIIRWDGSWDFTPVSGYKGTVPNIKYTLTNETSVSSAYLRINVIDSAPPVLPVIEAVDDVADIANVHGTARYVVAKDRGLLANDKGNDARNGNNFYVSHFEVDSQEFKAGSAAKIKNAGELTIKSDGSWEFQSFYIGNKVSDVSVKYTLSNGITDSASFLRINLHPAKQTQCHAVDDAIDVYPDKYVEKDVKRGLLSNDTNGLGPHTDLRISHFEVQGKKYQLDSGPLDPGYGRPTYNSYVMAPAGFVEINPDGSYKIHIVGEYIESTLAVKYTVTNGATSSNAVLLVNVVPQDSLNVIPVFDNAYLIVGDTYEKGYKPFSVTAEKGLLSNDKNESQNNPLYIKYFEAPTFDMYSVPGKELVIPGKGRLRVESDGAWEFIPKVDLKSFLKAFTSDGNVVYIDDIHTEMPVLSFSYTVSNGLNTDDKTIGSFHLSLMRAPSRLLALDDAADIHLSPYSVSYARDTNRNVLINDKRSQNSTKPLSVTSFEVDNRIYKAGHMAPLAGVGHITIGSDGEWRIIRSRFPEQNPSLQPSATIRYMIEEEKKSSWGRLSLNILNQDLLACFANRDSVNLYAGHSYKTSVGEGLLSNDLLPSAGGQGDILSFVINGNEFKTGVPVNIPNLGSLLINSDGSWEVTPEVNAHMRSPFTVKYLMKNQFTQTEGEFVINILSGNVSPYPYARNDFIRISPKSFHLVNAENGLLKNDFNPLKDKQLRVAHWEVEGAKFSPSQAASLPGVGRLTIHLDGSWIFDPEPRHIKKGAFPVVRYTITNGFFSSEANFSIRFSNLKNYSRLKAVDDAVSVYRKPSQSVDSSNGLLANDIQGSESWNPLKISHFEVVRAFGYDRRETNFKAGESAYVSGFGYIQIMPDGSWSLNPHLHKVRFSFSPHDVSYNYNIDQSIVVKYVLTDGVNSAAGLFTVNIIPADTSSFVAQDDVAEVYAGHLHSVSASSGLLSNDIGGGSGREVVYFTIADTGTPYEVNRIHNIRDVGHIMVRSDGSWSFRSNAPWQAGKYLKFNYFAVADGSTLSSNAYFDIEVRSPRSLRFARSVRSAQVDDNHILVENGFYYADAYKGLLKDTHGKTLPGTQYPKSEISYFTFGNSTEKFSPGLKAKISGGHIQIMLDGSWFFYADRNYKGKLQPITYIKREGKVFSQGVLNITVLDPFSPVVNRFPTVTLFTSTPHEFHANNGLFPAGKRNHSANMSDPLVLGFTVLGGDSNHYHRAGNTASISGFGKLRIQPNGAWNFDPALGAPGSYRSVRYVFKDGDRTYSSILNIHLTSPVSIPLDLRKPSGSRLPSLTLIARVTPRSVR